MAKLIRTKYASKSIGPYIVQVEKYPEAIKIEISREGIIREVIDITSAGFNSTYPEGVDVTLEDLAFSVKISGAAREYCEALGMM